MLRQVSGFKAECGPLTLFIASDFDEWRVLARTSDTLIRGGRAFSEAKAKEQALGIAKDYLAEFGGQAPEDLQWAEMRPGEWLNWQP